MESLVLDLPIIIFDVSRINISSHVTAGLQVKEIGSDVVSTDPSLNLLSKTLVV